MIRLLGLAKRAGKLEIGEEPVGAVARSKQAKLIMLASDAPENTVRRGNTFSQIGNVRLITIPHTKDEVGFALGRSSIAMLALTDAGIAGAIGDRLVEQNPEKYGEVGAQLRQKADKSLARQKEKRQHEKNLQRGKGKPWAMDPKIAKEREEKRLKKNQKVEYIDVEEDFEQSILKKIKNEEQMNQDREKDTYGYKSERKSHGNSDGYKKDGYRGEGRPHGNSDGYKKSGYRGEGRSHGNSDGYKKDGYRGEGRSHGNSDGYNKGGYRGEGRPHGNSVGYKKDGYKGERNSYGKSDSYKGKGKSYGNSSGYKKGGQQEGTRKKSDGYKSSGAKATFQGEEVRKVVTGKKLLVKSRTRPPVKP